MAIIEWKKDETAAIVTLNHGENRHNPDFVREFLKVFDEIEQDPELQAVAIVSSDKKNWSLGIDLDWMMGAIGGQQMQAIKDFMYGLDKIFIRLLTFPMPVIASINGHAFGNGANLACACDFRLMKSDRGYFCFPEVDVDIPLMPGMIEVVKKAIPFYLVEDLVYSGRRTTAPELAAHHVLVKACADNESLLRETLAFAKSFNKKRPIFGELKRRFYKNAIETTRRDDAELIEAFKLMM